jgi:hypothetical protein
MTATAVQTAGDITGEFLAVTDDLFMKQEDVLGRLEHVLAEITNSLAAIKKERERRCNQKASVT